MWQRFKKDFKTVAWYTKGLIIVGVLELVAVGLVQVNRLLQAML